LEVKTNGEGVKGRGKRGGGVTGERRSRRGDNGEERKVEKRKGVKCERKGMSGVVREGRRLEQGGYGGRLKRGGYSNK